MYDSLLIARYIMAKCNELKKDNPDYEYNNTKIQKLLYVLYGFYLARKQLPLTGEPPKLWPYGPAFVNVFLSIQENGVYMSNTKTSLFDNILDEDKKEFDGHINDFGKFMATTLTKWSHEDGSPWSRTKDEVGEKWDTPIKDEYIEEYFKKLL
ncbi:MAG: DUF4065 domain-containing protein [Puniceicoccales bacterium]|jgi:uncharacterized phage-associated protein|nr:DUF4065 domain-containing protein [Puniceicoccales bacterium]